MPIFKRIRIRATVETSEILVPEHQIDAALDELRDRLKRLDLAVVELESKEPPPLNIQDGVGSDPWSVRGQPVD